MKYAANNRVLRDNEARGLLTFYLGTKPDPPLVFSETRRKGNTSLVEFKGTSVSKYNLHFPTGTYCALRFGANNMAGIQAEISEVHFSNPADFPIDNIQIIFGDRSFTCDKVEKIIGKMLHNFPVYKAIFDKPVTYYPENYHAQVHFKTKSYSGTATAAIINGNSNYHSFTLNGRSYGVTLWSHSDYSWWFLVALRIKLLKA